MDTCSLCYLTSSVVPYIKTLIGQSPILKILLSIFLSAKDAGGIIVLFIHPELFILYNSCTLNLLLDLLVTMVTYTTHLSPISHFKILPHCYLFVSLFVLSFVGI